MLIRRNIRTRFTPLAATVLAAGIGLCGCIGGSNNQSAGNGNGSSGENNNAGRASDQTRRYPLDSLPTSTVSINEHTFRVWLAQEDDAQRPGVVAEGLMHVPPEEIEDDQGMLFVFTDERLRGFWMLNTITPLDIAYARADGTIVRIAAMAPLTLRSHSSIEPAMFALEVKQGTFQRLGIQEGDRLVVPEDVFKTQP